MATILITGGTGLVGTALSKSLIEKGHNVIVLTRNPSSLISADKHLFYAHWDINKKQIDLPAIQEADYIIHLAGAGVMDKKWDITYKKEIVDSRVESANLLVDHLTKHTNKVKAVISASAIGWYRPGNNLHTEEEPSDQGFLGETCRLWEESIQPVQQLGKRLVTFRIGIVLSKNGGALAEFIKPLKYRIAAILGNGQQIISWIHIEDLCNMFIYAIENNNLKGSYNAVAPEPVTNKEMTLALAKKISGKFYLPLHVPAFILKLMLGGRSIEILKSAAISCKKILDTGFTFHFKKIEKAVDDLINR